MRMRINANKKIHKMKKDPYQQLLKTAGILAILVVIGGGAFFLCRFLIENEYRTKARALEKYNMEAQQEFNAKMNTLRSNASGSTEFEEVVDRSELQHWESTIDGAVWRIEDEGKTGLENTRVQTLDRTTLMHGGLLLVNPWHPLPSDFSDVELVGVGTASGYKIQVQDNTVKLLPNAFDALQAMVTAAGEDKLEDYMVREAYRTMDMQTQLFDKQKEKLSADYSGDILIEQTKKSVNFPGTSEYQSGLSFRMDIYNKSNPDLPKFQQSDQGKWFTEHGWKYGVIFRFPTADFPSSAWEDKSYKTGVSIQMNLYRFVGKAHAAAMRIMDYCLEEYVEFLVDHPHICIYKDGQLLYEVFRLPAPEVLTTYDLPVTNPSSDFQASMDNLDGIVMAYTYNQ